MLWDEECALFQELAVGKLECRTTPTTFASAAGSCYVLLFAMPLAASQTTDAGKHTILPTPA
eukprot:scaffold160029_cov18-Tisochrysis_lutea.AAC.1